MLGATGALRSSAYAHESSLIQSSLNHTLNTDIVSVRPNEDSMNFPESKRLASPSSAYPPPPAEGLILTASHCTPRARLTHLLAVSTHYLASNCLHSTTSTDCVSLHGTHFSLHLACMCLKSRGKQLPAAWQQRHRQTDSSNGMTDFRSRQTPKAWTSSPDTRTDGARRRS